MSNHTDHNWEERYAKQCARRAAAAERRRLRRAEGLRKKETLKRSEDIAAELVADNDARNARHLMTPPDYRTR